MMKRQRLTGVDLFRGIAAYAVAVLHSGDETTATVVNYWAAEVRHFCGFAVPFFLATSFYLIINKLYINGADYSLKSRMKRIVIPYFIWSIIYLFSRSVKFLISNKPEEFNKLFSDPISIIFFGGAEVQLYFLPILLTGTILVRVAQYLLKNSIKVNIIFLLLGLSLIIYETLIVSGNSFELDPNSAFQSLLSLIWPDGNKNSLVRVLLVELSWMVRCLPYIFISMILNHLFIRKNIKLFNTKITIILLAIFLFINTFEQSFIPQSVREVAIAYCGLLFAISLSTDLKENRIFASLGLCSFGIYLMHYLVIQNFRFIAGRIYPEALNEVTVISQLTFATLGFMISWIVTSFFLSKKNISKFMFGV